jgi:hypothetical protein
MYVILKTFVCGTPLTLRKIGNLKILGYYTIYIHM